MLEEMGYMVIKGEETKVVTPLGLTHVFEFPKGITKYSRTMKSDDFGGQIKALLTIEELQELQEIMAML